MKEKITKATLTRDKVVKEGAADAPSSEAKIMDMPPPKPVPFRADIPPSTGYSMVVDGHFKSLHETSKAAEAAGAALKAKFPMLQVQVYNAASKTRTPVE